MAQPLMPHATASWLVDNTALTFEQIAEFCGLHILEVQAIADDTAATKLTGRDPIRAGELTQEEIERGQADPDYRLRSRRSRTRSAAPRARATRRSRSARTSRTASPGSSATIPRSRTAQIGKLIGTTRTTIAAIRDRSHWNIANIQPKDPVTLGLCSQRELDAIVAKAAKAAGIEPAPQDHRLAGDREALIEELRAERETAAREAEAAHAAEAAGEAAPRGGPTVDDLFKS